MISWSHYLRNRISIVINELTLAHLIIMKPLWMFIPLLLITLQVKAEPPACRDFTDFNPGFVCYTEHQYEARQRDVDGTQEHHFIIERISPDWIIVDYLVIRDGGFGTVSLPTGSIVSSTGNANIISVTKREIDRLNEVKSKLQGKLQGCYPPLCGEIQGNLESINRETEKLSNYQQIFVSAGGNEKISFSYTTHVSCTLGVCGPGANIHGKVRVNQRYLGNPNAIQQASLSLVEQSESVIAKLNKQTDTTAQPSNTTCPSIFSPSNFGGKVGKVAFMNEWSSPITVVLYHPNNQSIYNRYTVLPGQNNILGSNIIIGDDWGVCFENKPGSSGVVNNIGVVSGYDQNYPGGALFMIQNQNIR